MEKISEIEKEKETEKEVEKEKELEEEKEIFICSLNKCSECNEESMKLNLCQKCNINKGYYPLYINEELNLIENNYIDCYNETTKPEGFYLDKEIKKYKLCYSSCKTCNFGGDGNENNCTSCKNNQILKPDIPNSTNCVSRCTYFYYYQGGQYKCTGTEICPDKYQLEIKEKKKCIDKCENDDVYNIQYDGECYRENPDGTQYDELKKISKDIDLEKCKLNEKQLRLLSNENITENEIINKAKLYAKEFYYTERHVTVYKNNFYSITLYKDSYCLSELGLIIDDIDFGNCYIKIKEAFNISGKLIIVIISKIINNISKTIDKFIFSPNKGEKINFVEICINETVTVKKDIKEQLKNTENMESLEQLADQGIDIFNASNEFYTDLCFHFKSPISGKDIPLKDRFKLFYPNITLCDEGCQIKGVNLTTWKVNCECALNNLLQKNFLSNNFLVQQSLGGLQDFLTKTNIEVMKCYKDIFDKEIYKSNSGMIIIFVFITIQIIMIFIYFFKYKMKIKKYLMTLTDKFISYLRIQKNLNLVDSLSIKENNSNIIPKNAPPKKSSLSKINIDRKNDEKLENKNLKNANKNMIMKINTRKSKSYMNFEVLNKSSKKIVSNSKNDSKQNSNANIIKNLEKLEDKNKEFEPMINDLQNNLNINIDDYLKTDPDDMDYDEAIRGDKRTYCQYFFDKVINEQILINTFFTKEVLKPLPIKIILLVLNTDLYFIINALFFNEDYISDLLDPKNDNTWSFINRILDRIITLTIIGVIINYIIEFFFIEEKKIKRIFRVEKDNILILKYEIVKMIKSTYIRYNIFIIISMVIMIFSLYYIFCFNNIYPSMKGEWIKSSLIIIAFMQVFPIFLSFLDASIRFISFKCKSERLFRLSSILL